MTVSIVDSAGWANTIRASRRFSDELRLRDRSGTYAFSNWLFFVDDGSSETPAVSAESIPPSDDTTKVKTMVVCRADPLTSGVLQQLDAIKLFDVSDVTGFQYYDPFNGIYQKYTDFADHWHIYAHGYHWIATSLIRSKQGLGVYLVQFEFTSTGVRIERADVVFSPTPSDYWGTRQKNPTNDLFLVETPNGVAVGIRQDTVSPVAAGSPEPDKGHLILQIEEDGPGFQVTGRVEVLGERTTLWPAPGGSAAPYSHENGASCYPVKGVSLVDASPGSPQTGLSTDWRYLLFAPEYIVVHVPGDIRQLELSADFDKLSVETAVHSDGTKSLSMPTVAWVPYAGGSQNMTAAGSGSMAMVWKRVHVATTNTHDFEDYGELTMRVHGGTTTGPATGFGQPAIEYQDIFMTRTGWKANRPHITYWKDHLIVGWDGGQWSLLLDEFGAPQTNAEKQGRIQYTDKGCHATVYKLDFY